MRLRDFSDDSASSGVESMNTNGAVSDGSSCELKKGVESPSKFRENWHMAQTILLQANSNLSLGSTRSGLHKCQLCGLRFPRDEMLQRHHSRHMQALVAQEVVSKWRRAQLEASVETRTDLPFSSELGDFKADGSGGKSREHSCYSFSNLDILKRKTSELLASEPPSKVKRVGERRQAIEASASFENQTSLIKKFLKLPEETSPLRSATSAPPSIQNSAWLPNIPSSSPPNWTNLLNSGSAPVSCSSKSVSPPPHPILLQAAPSSSSRSQLASFKLPDGLTFSELWKSQKQSVESDSSKFSSFIEASEKSSASQAPFMSMTPLQVSAASARNDSEIDLELRL